MDVFDLVAKITVDTSEYQTGLNEASNDTSSFGSKLASGLGTAAKIGVGAVSAVTAATGVASAVFSKTTSDVATYGDNIDKMSQKMGLSAEAYQEWDAVLQHSGSSIESMKASMKTLANAAETDSEAFQRLGISQEEIANMSQEELFEATITALQNVEDTTERTYLAGKTLGRGATELGALLNTSAEDTQAMRDRVHELSGVMSDEAVKSAAAYQDSLQDMQTAIGGIKRNIISDFLPSVTTVMDGLQEVFAGDSNNGVGMITEGINGIIDNLNTAIPKLFDVGGKILGALFNAIIDNLPKIIESGTKILLELVQGIVQALPNLLQSGLEIIVTLINGITNALPNLIDTLVTVIIQIAEAFTNPDTITKIIEAGVQMILALVDGLVKAIPQLVKAIPKIINNIVQAVIQALPVLIEGAIQLVMGIVNALPEIIQALIDAIPQIVEAIVDGLIIAIPLLIQGAIQLVLAIVDALPEIIQALIDAIPQIIEGIIEAFSPIVDMFGEVFSEAWNSIQEVFANVGEWFSEKFTEAKELASMAWSGIKEKMSQHWKNIQIVYSAVGNWFSTTFESAKNLASSAFSGISSRMTTHFNNIKSVFSGIGGWFSAKFTDAKNKAVSAWNNIKSNFVAIVNNIKSAFTNGGWSGVGRAIIDGIKSGISNAASQIYETMKNIAKGALNIVKSFLGIKSPSRVFREQVGKMISEGWALGIEDGQSDIINSLKGLSDMSVADINVSGVASGKNGYNGFSQTVNIYSPTQLAPSEVARQTRNATRNMVLAIRGAQ